MNSVYLLPFSYFFNTRLRFGSLTFHLVFEWLAAATLVCLLGAQDTPRALFASALSYVAFISLYEIGYMVNDFFAAAKESDGRMRGPQNVGRAWLVAWFLSRLAAFSFATYLAGQASNPMWWSFFVALCLVFSCHNFLVDREFKSATFLWLAWFRFMAPIIFAVQPSQRTGIGFAAAMAYCAFRLFGYLDSKGLLKMPGRQRPSFRLFFFSMPLFGAFALWPDSNARGFVFLSLYFFLVSVVGTCVNRIFPGASVNHKKA